MKRWAATLALIALAACTPPSGDNATNAEASVRAIYDTAQQNVGHAVTSADDIPMTEDLRTLLDRAEAAAATRAEPFIEGDLALNCQDCTSLDALAVGPQSGPQQEPAAPGHQWVVATFTLNGDEPRRVLWDMTEQDGAWRVDNIIADGFDLRAEAQTYLDAPGP